MKKMLFAMAVVQGLLIAQNPCGAKCTFGMQNGRHWTAMPEGDARYGFVEGVFEGWRLRDFV